MISYLTLFFFWWEYYLLSRLQGIIIYHSYLVCSPRRSLPSPAVFPPPAVVTHALPSSNTPYSPAQFWPSCHLPCPPHKSAISQVSLYTKNGLARRAWPSLEDFALHWTTASGPVLCHPSCPLGIIPVVPMGPLCSSEYW